MNTPFFCNHVICFLCHIFPCSISFHNITYLRLNISYPPNWNSWWQEVTPFRLLWSRCFSITLVTGRWASVHRFGPCLLMKLLLKSICCVEPFTACRAKLGRPSIPSGSLLSCYIWQPGSYKISIDLIRAKGVSWYLCSTCHTLPYPWRMERKNMLEIEFSRYCYGRGV